MERKAVRRPMGVVDGFLAFVAHASAAKSWTRLTPKRCVIEVGGARTACDPTPDDADGKGGAVILRVWRAKLDPAHLEEYRRFERDRCLPMLHKQPGFLGVLFLRSMEGHAASITIWEDRGTVEALESSASYSRTIRELAESGLLAGEHSVEILEVVSGVLRSEPLTTALNPGADRSYPGGATT